MTRIAGGLGVSVGVFVTNQKGVSVFGNSGAPGGATVPKVSGPILGVMKVDTPVWVCLWSEDDSATSVGEVGGVADWLGLIADARSIGV